MRNRTKQFKLFTNIKRKKEKDIMMFEIISGIVIFYGVTKICGALETMAKDYDEKINDGWIDYRSIKGIGA